LALLAQYAQQALCNGPASVCPSVCLSVPSFVGRTPLLRGCAAERRAADIDRLLSSTALGSKRGQ